MTAASITPIDTTRETSQGATTAPQGKRPRSVLAGDAERVVAVGGGVQNELWLQIMSDVTGRRQIVPETSIGASYGDAFLAGLAAGIIPDLEALHRDWVRVDRVIEPDSVRGALYDDYFAVYASLYPRTRDAMHRLADLGRRDPSNRPESSI